MQYGVPCKLSVYTIWTGLTAQDIRGFPFIIKKLVWFDLLFKIFRMKPEL